MLECNQNFVVGESCWWTIHPASKQRSEGEKVRVGDDLILVSVSSERYLVSEKEEKWNHRDDFFISFLPAKLRGTTSKHSECHCSVYPTFYHHALI